MSPSKSRTRDKRRGPIGWILWGLAVVVVTAVGGNYFLANYINMVVKLDRNEDIEVVVHIDTTNTKHTATTTTTTLHNDELEIKRDEENTPVQTTPGSKPSELTTQRKKENSTVHTTPGSKPSELTTQRKEENSKVQITPGSKPPELATQRKTENSTVHTTTGSTTSIPPLQMEVRYYEMWNHTTQTIRVPKAYKNPFNISPVPPPTSLEILQNVLHGRKYKNDIRLLENYLQSTSWNGQIPKCLVPDLNATRTLADAIVKKRRAYHNQNPQPKRTYDPKQQHLIWPREELMLPLPILHVGFPKTGTTSLHDYFECIGLQSSHSQNGVGMYRELQNGKQRLFRYDPKYIPHVMAQLDSNLERGFYPQIQLLDELHEELPNSTFVFNFRPIQDWIHSVRKFRKMGNRMASFVMPGLQLTEEQVTHNELMMTPKFQEIYKKKRPSLPLSDVQFAKWWCGHVLHIREYVKAYPSHTLIELDLYDTEGIEDLLYDLIRADIDAHFGETARNRTQKCWGKSNELASKTYELSNQTTS